MTLEVSDCLEKKRILWRNAVRWLLEGRSASQKQYKISNKRKINAHNVVMLSFQCIHSISHIILSV